MKGVIVLSSRMRAVLFGTLAMLMVGAFASAAAYAEPGPFWHHRVAGSGEKPGLKIEEKSPETFEGTGGLQTFKGEASAGHAVEFQSESVAVKGIVYNNALQGQIKLELKYPKVNIIKPSEPGCTALVGTSNTVNTVGHLVWKWNGEKEQLKIKPQSSVQGTDILFTPVEIKEGIKELTEGTFTKFTFTGTCGILVSGTNVKGSTVGSPVPANLEEWSKTLEVTTLEGKAKQHFWNGKEFIGLETGLTFAGLPASLTGKTTVTAATQEIAVFEK